MGTTSDVWCPKAGFKGLVFAKFADTSMRDKFVTEILSVKPEYEGAKVWARAEAPRRSSSVRNIFVRLEKDFGGLGVRSKLHQMGY